MKVTLTILIALLSNFLNAQSKKGETSVCPQVFLNNNTFEAGWPDFSFGVGTAMHYYLWKQISVGGILVQDFAFVNADHDSFKQVRSGIRIIPQIQYNVLNRKVTPFVQFRVFEDFFEFRQLNTNNPTIPVRQRKVKNFAIDYRFNYGIGMGFNYSLNSVTGLYGIINLTSFNSFLSIRSYGLGAQFCINRRKNGGQR